MTQYHDQEKLLEITSLVAQSGRSQAFIFGGSKGIGKAIAAKELASNLLSHDNDFLHNLLWVSPESEVITVEQVRKIKDFLGHTSHNHLYRIVVIDSADDLNKNAANALLKILEEPPEQSLLILISHKPYNLMATIRSRCSIIRFCIPSDSLAIMDKTDIETKEGDKLIRLAHNIPGIAVKLAENQALDCYGDLISAILDDEYYKFVDSYFSDTATEKWWLFSYLMQYLLEKTIRTNSLGCHDNYLFISEKNCINQLLANRSRKKWFLVYDQLLNLSEVTKKLHLDCKSAAVAMMQLIDQED